MKNKIDPSKQKAKIIKGILNITLFKIIVEPWTDLQSDEIISVTTRKILNAEVNSIESENTQKRIDRKIEDERFALRQQMAIDEAERTRLDLLKANVKCEAEESVYAVLDEFKTSTATTQRNTTMVDNNSNEVDSITDKPIDTIFQPVNRPEDVYVHVSRREAPLPGPRNFSTVRVPIHFSYREFPTPLRESKVAEEQDWLAKNGKHLNKHAIFGNNVPINDTYDKCGKDVLEEDPLWLKEKGDNFFNHGDFLSAISAYTSALDILYKMNSFIPSSTNESLTAELTQLWMFNQSYLSMLSNRADCYFQTRRYSDCGKDCQLVISIIKSRFREVAGDQNNSSICTSDVAIQALISASAQLAICHCANLAYNESIICYEENILLLQHLNSDSGEASISAAESEYDLTKTMSTDQIDDDRRKYVNKLSLHTLDNSVRSHIVNKYFIPEMKQELSVVRVLAQAKDLKVSADQMLGREKDIDKAICLYNECLGILPYYVSALSNRATCHLSVSDFAWCVRDCSTALSLLGHPSGIIRDDKQRDTSDKIEAKENLDLRQWLSQHIEMSQHTTVSKPAQLLWNTFHNNSSSDKPSVALRVMYESIMPVSGSEKHKVSLIHTLCRRGMALLKLQESELALQDYQFALSLDPTNKNLMSDCERMKQLIANVV